MSTQPTVSTPTVNSDAAQGGGDWARALLDRQLQILSALAEGGLLIAQAIQRQAAPDDGAAPAVVQGDITLAYDRVSRAVRQTLMLQSKVIEERRALDAASADKDRQVSDLAGARDPRTGGVLRMVRHAAEAEGEDSPKVERLVREAAERMERLEQDDIYADAMSRPVSALIVQICADLGLHPDWPRLAEEALAEADRKTAELDSKTEHIVFSWRDPEPEPIGPQSWRRDGLNSNPRAALDQGEDSG